MSDSAFSSLSLNAGLLDNLQSLGYEQMTPIQMKALPLALAGQDVIAQAKTGSGKTAAFGLAVLNKLQVKKFAVQSLIICPTRELADQVAQELRKLARAVHNIKILTLCGGMPFGPQIGSLEHGAHIVVGTPGRIDEHLNKGTLKLHALTTVVLDEADRMLDMGFQPAIDAILEFAPQQRQTLLFSATYPAGIEAIASRYMQSPQMVKVEEQITNSDIRQRFYLLASAEQRLAALEHLLLIHQPQTAVVFCNTKLETTDVANELFQRGFSAIALHGDLEQRQRDEAMVMFNNNSVNILVATDVAARGLDVDDVDVVVNYQPAREPEVHVHRVGRTGRAGKNGLAITLLTEKEHFKVQQLEQLFQQTLLVEKLPEQLSGCQYPATPEMATIQIGGGKKQKLRPGDIVGGLTGGGIAGEDIGKIAMLPNSAYVAVRVEVVKKALAVLGNGKLKGRSFRVRRIHPKND